MDVPFYSRTVYNNIVIMSRIVETNNSFEGIIINWIVYVFMIMEILY